MAEQTINNTQSIINETIVQSSIQFQLQEELIRKSTDLFRDLLEVPADSDSPHPVDWQSENALLSSDELYEKILGRLEAFG